jgi:hypothetical protein
MYGLKLAAARQAVPFKNLGSSARRKSRSFIEVKGLKGMRGNAVLEEGHGFSRVPMSLRLTQGDENQGQIE